MPRFAARIRRSRRGDFQLRLPPEERALLRTLPEQLRDLLSSDDPALERLFPPAYPDDPLRNEEYAQMVRGDLLAGRLAAVEVMEATIDAERLDEEQLSAWLSAVNDLRLVLGSRLEITEDLYDEGLPDGDPRAPAFAVYLYLGLLEEQAVEALAAGIDPRGVA
jgi:hypothetical protein